MRRRKTYKDKSSLHEIRPSVSGTLQFNRLLVSNAISYNCAFNISLGLGHAFYCSYLLANERYGKANIMREYFTFGKNDYNDIRKSP